MDGAISGKKIVLLVTQSKYGGTQKYILQLAQHFKANNDVLIVVGNQHEQDERFFSEARGIGIEPIVLTKLVRDISLVKATEAVFELRTLLQKEKPDILHINSSMAGAVGSAAALLYRMDPLNRTLAVIYTVHGFVFNEPMTPLRKKVYLFIERTSARWKGAMICVSEFDKNVGLQYHIASDRKLVVIHNGIDSISQPLSRDAAITQLDVLPKSRPVIGTVGSLYKTKGHEYLIRSVSILREKYPDIQCIIIGEGPERDALTSEIKRLNLENNVSLTGSLSNATQLMTAFDVFVLPSVKEGLSFTLLEAGSVALPVVATSVGGNPEIVENEKTGLLVQPQSPEALAQGVQTLLSSSSFAEKLGKSLQEKIITHFTQKQMLEKTEQLYLQLVGKPATDHPVK